MTLRCLIALGLLVAAPAAAKDPKPLFEASDVLRITIRGPVQGANDKPRAASLQVGAETLPIALTARGLTRRKAETCQFPPLRVAFTQPPAKTSLFAGQGRLKLVTHCRGAASFQQYILLEYAAYRLLNRLTPASFRARLALIDYVSENGRPITSRYGFFIEDIDDVARRNGMREPKVGDQVPLATISPAHAARVAMFQHMIGNHDWSLRSGPPGAGCCHNGRLIGPVPGSSLLVPVPYDFDFSGMVNAPYAVPPDQLGIADVRQRHYQGFCSHNPHALRAAAEIRSARSDLLAVLAATPGLEEPTRKRAATYLDRFFADIATDALVTSKALKTCR